MTSPYHWIFRGIHHWTLWGQTTGHLWIPLIKGQWSFPCHYVIIWCGKILPYRPLIFWVKTVALLSSDPFHWFGVFLIPEWINNYIHYEILTVQPLKFGNGKVISSHISLDMLLFIHAGIKVDPSQLKGARAGMYHRYTALTRGMFGVDGIKWPSIISENMITESIKSISHIKK